MQSSRWWVAVVIVVGLAACGARGPYDRRVQGEVASSSRHATPLAAGSRLRPKSWRTGQWARYGLRNGDLRGHRYVAFVAVDACGLWFVDVQTWPAGERRWMFCIRPRRDDVPKISVVIETTDGAAQQVRYLNDAEDQVRYAWLATKVWGAPWSADAPREDVDVPAGLFLQAVTRRSRGGGRRWEHPEAPFDGLVRGVWNDGRNEEELIATGERGAGSVIPGLAERPERRPSEPPPPVRPTDLFFGYSGSLQWDLAGGRDTDSAPSLTTFLGLRSSPKLDVILGVGIQRLVGGDTDATLFHAGGAMRWRPFRAPSRRSASKLYVKGGLSYANLLETGTASDLQYLGHGVMVGTSVGYLVGRDDRDWRGAIEVGNQLVILRREGILDFIGVTFSFELDLYLDF